MLTLKQKLADIFTTIDRRYDNDPEKQNTLAAVIGIVDYTKLSDAAKNTLLSLINTLEKDLKRLGDIPLKQIEIVILLLPKKP